MKDFFKSINKELSLMIDDFEEQVVENLNCIK